MCCLLAGMHTQWGLWKCWHRAVRCRVAVYLVTHSLVHTHTHTAPGCVCECSSAMRVRTRTKRDRGLQAGENKLQRRVNVSVSCCQRLSGCFLVRYSHLCHLRNLSLWNEFHRWLKVDHRRTATGRRHACLLQYDVTVWLLQSRQHSVSPWQHDNLPGVPCSAPSPVQHTGRRLPPSRRYRTPTIPGTAGTGHHQYQSPPVPDTINISHQRYQAPPVPDNTNCSHQRYCTLLAVWWLRCRYR